MVDFPLPHLRKNIAHGVYNIGVIHILFQFHLRTEEKNGNIFRPCEQMHFQFDFLSFRPDSSVKIRDVQTFETVDDYGADEFPPDYFGRSFIKCAAVFVLKVNGVEGSDLSAAVLQKGFNFLCRTLGREIRHGSAVSAPEFGNQIAGEENLIELIATGDAVEFSMFETRYVFQ